LPAVGWGREAWGAEELEVEGDLEEGYDAIMKAVETAWWKIS
jgi:hypothetical protein